MNGWELIKHIVDTAYDHYIVTFIFIFLWRCGSMQFHEDKKPERLLGLWAWYQVSCPAKARATKKGG